MGPEYVMNQRRELLVIVHINRMSIELDMDREESS